MKQVIFEYVRVGRYVKVTATDTETGEEVAIVADADASESAMQHIALQKLKRVMAAKTADPHLAGLY
jgi:hypothetical protein